MSEQTITTFGAEPPPEVEILGMRGVITGGRYHEARQAVYTQQQLDESTAAPPPAATPLAETSLTLEVTILYTPTKTVNEILADLRKLGVMVKYSSEMRGIR